MFSTLVSCDNVLLVGSMAPAKVQVCGSQDAQKLQDIAAERCSMPYRAPELFNVESYCVIDERTDIWVSTDQSWARVKYSLRNSFNNRIVKVNFRFHI